jgi:hypothetical protein
MARAASGTRGQARDLARLRRRLDDWRGSHRRGAAFPLQLWSAVRRVARRHGAYVTARALGLDYNKVKGMSGGVIGQVPGKVTRPSTPEPMKFIELTGTLPVSPGGCRLSLQNANGQRLQLEMAPSAATEMVLQLCRSGWGAHP